MKQLQRLASIPSIKSSVSDIQYRQSLRTDNPEKSAGLRHRIN
jgi:tetrahydromethanopterin S-methyltransferase subunit F